MYVVQKVRDLKLGALSAFPPTRFTLSPFPLTVALIVEVRRGRTVFVAGLIMPSACFGFSWHPRSKYHVFFVCSSASPT